MHGWSAHILITTSTSGNPTSKRIKIREAAEKGDKDNKRH